MSSVSLTLWLLAVGTILTIVVVGMIIHLVGLVGKLSKAVEHLRLIGESRNTSVQGELLKVRRLLEEDAPTPRELSAQLGTLSELIKETHDVRDIRWHISNLSVPQVNAIVDACADYRRQRGQLPGDEDNKALLTSEAVRHYLITQLTFGLTH